MAAGAGALLVVIGGSVAGISAMVRDKPVAVQAAARDAAAVPPEVNIAPSKPASPPVAKAGLGVQASKHGSGGDAPAGGSRISKQADRSATRKPRETPEADKVRASARPSAAAPTTPAVTTRTVSETRPLPFQTQLVRDPSLPRGTRRVQVPGVVGEQTLRYLVTYAGGRETGRRLLDTSVTRQPQQQVVAFGPRRGLGPGRWHDRPPECGLVDDACVPISRSALCADEPKADTADTADTAAVTEPADSATDPAEPVEESGLLGDDTYLIDPADLAELELDPSVICD